MDSIGDAERNADENGGWGVADIRARKARTGDTEFAGAVRRMILGRQIMIEHGHLGGDQRHHGERRHRRARDNRFLEHLHDPAGKIYSRAAVATTTIDVTSTWNACPSRKAAGASEAGHVIHFHAAVYTDVRS